MLLVEDDSEISQSLADYLRDKGFAVQVAESAEAGRELLENGRFDLILLDVMLPGEDGLSFCRGVRASNGPPVIMLTALSEPTDAVVGLELGAEDYVSKPFDLRELLARIRTVLRRGQATEPASSAAATELVLAFSGFTFFPYRRYLRSPTNLRIPLTGAETDLLLVLCRHSRRVLSREELIRLTRGKDFPIAARSIDLLVSRLRRKLASDDPLDDPIRTMRTGGYAFQPEVTVR
ncbi:Transcriptional regulatory protein OmpR [Burkholderia sp. 8Y]|nr:Transcriptional regulatory protein OmpR [Burkholderia sp. 8Y]